MEKIILNSKYAPGISTYGAQGKDGIKGDNGKSIFYVPFAGEVFNTTLLDEYIKKNIIVGTNTSYNYQFGDTFVSNEGQVFRYDSSNGEGVLTMIASEIKSASDNYFKISKDNNYIYNVDLSKKIIFTDDSTNINGESIVNINSKDNNTLLSLSQSNNEMSFSFINNCFHINSTNPIIIENLLYTNRNTSFKPIENYYPVICNIELDKLLIIIDSSTKKCNVTATKELVDDFVLVLQGVGNDNLKYTASYNYILNNKLIDSSYNYTFNLDENIDLKQLYLELTSKYNFDSRYYEIIYEDVPQVESYNYDYKSNTLNITCKKDNNENDENKYMICFFNNSTLVHKDYISIIQSRTITNNDVVNYSYQFTDNEKDLYDSFSLSKVKDNYAYAIYGTIFFLLDDDQDSEDGCIEHRVCEDCFLEEDGCPSEGWDCGDDGMSF